MRRKKDVSDLEPDPLFSRRVLGKNDFFASHRTDPSAAVSPVCGTLSGPLQTQGLLVLGSVFVHGLRATDVSRKPARHRRLPERAPPDQLYHLGFRSRVCRSTSADANEARDWRIYADLATLLIKKARRLYAGQPLEVDAVGLPLFELVAAWSKAHPSPRVAEFLKALGSVARLPKGHAGRPSPP